MKTIVALNKTQQNLVNLVLAEQAKGEVTITNAEICNQLGISPARLGQVSKELKSLGWYITIPKGTGRIIVIDNKAYEAFVGSKATAKVKAIPAVLSNDILDSEPQVPATAQTRKLSFKNSLFSIEFDLTNPALVALDKFSDADRSDLLEGIVLFIVTKEVPMFKKGYLNGVWLLLQPALDNEVKSLISK